MAKRRLKQNRVIVTGASSGIGFELTRLLLERGSRVVATARREEHLNEILTDGVDAGQLEIVPGDITDPDHRQRLIDVAVGAFGGLDTVVNNAGISSLGSFEASTEEAMRQVMEVNFFAPVELIRLALPQLASGTRPLIVNISSVLGHRAVPQKSEYCASKFALHGFSDSLRAELAGRVDVLLVSPSTTQSEFFEHAVSNHSGKDWTPRKAMPPETVARKTAQAMIAGKHEVILSFGGKGLVLLDRLWPTMANRMVQKFG